MQGGDGPMVADRQTDRLVCIAHLKTTAVVPKRFLVEVTKLVIHLDNN